MLMYMLNVKRTSAAVALLLSLLAVVLGPKVLFSYGQSAARTVATAVEDRLPWSWKVRGERDAIAQLTARKAALCVERERLAGLRADRAATVQKLTSEKAGVVRTAENCARLRAAMDNCGVATRILDGRPVTREELEANRKRLIDDAARTDAAISAERRQLAAIDADVAGLDGSIAELARATGERKTALATLESDKVLLEAELLATRSRLAVRGLVTSGDEAGAARREIDEKKTALMVARETLGDSPDRPFPTLNADAIDRAADATDVPPADHFR